MKIAVTGGSGFIGSSLCKELLDSNHQVTIIDINDPTLVTDDNLRFAE